MGSIATDFPGKMLLIAAGILCSAVYTGAESFAPGPDHVIDRNIARLAVPRIIGTDTVGSVTFTAHYAYYATNKIDHAQKIETVAVITAPPFETVWGCADVPDQDRYNLHFRYQITDIHGRRITFPIPQPSIPGSTSTNYYYIEAALDRNPAVLNKVWTAERCIGRITVDGNAAEWPAEPSVSFSNSGNRITGRAAWDDTRLYLAVTVYDPAEAADPGMDTVSAAAYLQDGIEVFLDPDHRRRSVRDARVYQVMIPTTGPYTTYTGLSDADYDAGVPEPSYAPVTAVVRNDTSYTVELSFTWDELGITPQAGRTIGLNLVNSDLDVPGGVVITASWAGISDLCHHNPGEWGTLVLAGRPFPVTAAVLIGIIAAALGLTLLLLRRRNAPAPETPGSAPPDDPVICAVMEYVNENLGREGLDLKTAAAHVDRSPAYLRQQFKKHTGSTFTDYLNARRVERAATLLTSTNRQITEIGFEAGFNTYQSFNRIFRKIHGCTPREYRVREAGKD